MDIPTNTHGGKRPGAGAKPGHPGAGGRPPKPPRIDNHGNLIFNTRHLTRERKTELMALLRDYWLPDTKEQ